MIMGVDGAGVGGVLGEFDLGFRPPFEIVSVVGHPGLASAPGHESVVVLSP